MVKEVIIIIIIIIIIFICYYFFVHIHWASKVGSCLVWFPLQFVGVASVALMQEGLGCLVHYEVFFFFQCFVPSVRLHSFVFIFMLLNRIVAVSVFCSMNICFCFFLLLFVCFPLSRNKETKNDEDDYPSASDAVGLYW